MTTAVILLVSFLLLGTAFSAFTYRYARNEKRAAMRAAETETIRLVTAYRWAGTELSDLELRMALSGLANTSGFHMLLCSRDGTVVSCSDREFNCGHLGMRLPGELTESLACGFQVSGVSDLSGIYSARRYYLASSGEAEGMQ